MSAKKPHFELNLFGTFQLHWDGQPLGGISSPKIQALLAYLAVEPAQPYSREQMATLLWPDHDAAKGRQNLRQSLTRLGRALAAAGAPDLLQVDRQVVLLAQEAPLVVDYRQFREALAAVDAHRHDSVVECTHCAGLLAAAVSQQRGQFLAGLYPESETFDEWALLQREWARREGLMALANLARYHLEQGDYQQAYDYAWQQISLEPLDEGAQQLVLQALGHLGRVRDARLQYERFAEVLAAELGVEPLPETATLVARIERGELQTPARVVPVQSDELVGLQNRPVHFTPFVGRARELTRLASYLAEPNIRLITLLGPGGVGKTRLASEAAAVAAPHFPQGAWFFPLVEITSQRELVDQLARVLGLQFSSRDTSIEQREQRLLAHLSGWRALFVLDNFEQLLAARPFLTALLTNAPDLLLLITSREPMELQAEWQIPLGGLDQTATDDGDGDSLALFTLLARQQRPDFVVDETSRPHLLAICELLAGLPLGLELAAAWLRHMSAAEILAALHENLDFLQTNRQDIEPRHRSLRAVFEQSWRHLTPQEQTQFLRLSLFRDGFDRAAAAAVAGADSLLLTRLYLVSLLKQEEDRRYQLHPLVGQFARELLGADPVLAAETERRHAAYFLGWFEAQAPAFKDLSGQAGPTLALVDSAYDNLRLAWSLAGRHQLSELQYRTTNLLLQYHVLRSRALDGAELFTNAIVALAEESDDPAQLALRLRLHVAAARMFGRLNQHDQVVSHAQAVIALEPGPEHIDELARAFLFWGLSLQDVGVYGEADQVMLQGLAQVQAAGANHLEPDFYRGLGNSASYQGDLQRSRHYWELSLENLEMAQSPRGMAATLGNLAEACTQSGEFDQARRYFGQAVEIFELIHDQSSWARCLNMLARAELLQGDVAGGAAHFAAAHEYLAAANETQFALDSAHGLLDAALQTGAYGRAAQLLGEIENQETIRPGQQAALQVLRARYYMLLGRYAEARAELAAALALTDDIFVLQAEFWLQLIAWRLGELTAVPAAIERCLATAQAESRGLELAQFQWLSGQMKLVADEAAAAVAWLAEAVAWASQQGVTPLWLQSSASLALAELQLGNRDRAGQILSELLAALAAEEPAGLPDPFLFYEQLLRALNPIQPERAGVLRDEVQRKFRAQQALITSRQDQQRFLRADPSRQFVLREPL